MTQYISVLITNDNRQVIAGTEDGTDRILVWDIETGAFVASVTHHHGGPIFKLAISPDGQAILSACDDEIIHIWERDTQKIIASISHDAQLAFDLAFYDDQTVYAGLSDERFMMWNIALGQSLHTLPLASKNKKGGLRTLHLNPDGTTLAVGYDWGLLEVWNRETATVLYTHTYDVYFMRHVRFSADGRSLLVTTHDHLQVMDAHTGRPVASLTDRLYDHGIFSRDGRWVLAVVRDADEHCIVWEWQTEQPTRVFSGHRHNTIRRLV